jgi:hypothetical protein
MNTVLNRTVSDARLTLLAPSGQPNHFTMAHLPDGRRPGAFALHGSSLRLLVSQSLEVEGEKTHTASYAYRLSTSDSKDAWLVRWEHYRRRPRPDYGYPLSHVHVTPLS